jgi:uroporphyrinogen-III synthase
VQPLLPTKRANSVSAWRKCSSNLAPEKSSKRSIASVAEQTPFPLAGKRVVITRAESQSATLATALRARSAEVVSFPLIQILPPQDSAALDAALSEFQSFDWLLFTSQNAVAATAARLTALQIDFRRLPGAAKIAVVGQATAEGAESAGFRVTHVGQGGTAAALVHEIALQLRGKRVLLPHSDRADSTLLQRLQRFGAEVTEVIAYRTADTNQVDSASREAIAKSDAILFFSPSAVHAFANLQKSSTLAALADTTVVGAIGPVTSVALRNSGLRCDFQASEPSVEEIVATLAVHFEKIKVQSASGANS